MDLPINNEELQELMDALNESMHPDAMKRQFRNELHSYIDYDGQFDKSFLEPLRFIVNAIGWNFEKTATLDSFF